MDISNNLPTKIPIFPLSNFIVFPETTVPLNIFEKRYLKMIDDSMASNRLIGMIQPKKTGNLKQLVVMGCLSERYPDELSKEIPEVDRFFGSNDHKQILSFITGKDYVKEDQMDMEGESNIYERGNTMEMDKKWKENRREVRWKWKGNKQTT